MNRKIISLIFLFVMVVNAPMLAVVFTHRDSTYLSTRPDSSVFNVDLEMGNSNADEGYIDDDQISLLWFVHVTDVHIKNTSDTEAREYAEFLNYSYNQLHPFSVIVSGDMIRWGLHEEYWKVLDASPYGSEPVVHRYLETVGNHDRRGDYGAVEFLNYTRTGRMLGSIQTFFTANLSRGSVAFSLLDSTPYEATPTLFGGESCLDSTDYAEYDQFLNNQSSDTTLFTFMHHSPIETWNLHHPTETAFPETFNQMSNRAGVDAVLFGHSHMAWTETVDNVVQIMGDRWADKYEEEDYDAPVGNYFNLVAVDGGRVSYVKLPFTNFPHVLITNPGNPLFLDPKDTHQTTRVDSHIRALVFENIDDPITTVEYQVDEEEWSPMILYPDTTMLYQSSIEALPDDGLDHLVRVRVTQASGKVTYQETIATTTPARAPFWEIVFACILIGIIGIIIGLNRDNYPLLRSDGTRRRLTHAEKEKKRQAVNIARGRPWWFPHVLAIIAVSMFTLPWGIFPLFKGLPGVVYSFMAFLPTGPIFYFETIEYAVPRILFILPMLYWGIRKYRPKLVTIGSFFLVCSAGYLISFTFESFGVLGLIIPGVYVDLIGGIALFIGSLKKPKSPK